MTPERAAHPVVVITQARMGSTRLPGKVLRPMYGKPMLWWHLSRLLRARTVDRVIVATTDEPEASKIAALADTLGVTCFHGSQHDVLARFAGAAALVGAATIVRVTSDCPLIDPVLLDDLVRTFLADSVCDYCSLDISQFPRGLDCEIFTRAALDEVAQDATDHTDREHVTLYMRQHPERYGLRFLTPPEALPPYRWCVDTQEDFDNVEQLLADIGAERLDFTWQELAILARSSRSAW